MPAGDLGLAHELALAAAGELAAQGVNLNLAPCADLNSNALNPVIGTRSYGSDPQAVAEMVAAVVRGYQSGGVFATAKHFPGHGDTHLDSHVTLPVVNHDRQVLADQDMRPFAAAAAAGVAAMMSAHIVVPWLTGDQPATFSRVALTDLLRGPVGHHGLVLTDCMEMDAIMARWAPAEATVRAVAAGADLVFWSHRADRQAQALAGVECALRTGQLAADCFAAAVTRVRRARHSLGLPPAAALAASGQHQPGPSPAGQAAAAEVYARSISLLGLAARPRGGRGGSPVPARPLLSPGCGVLLVDLVPPRIATPGVPGANAAGPTGAAALAVALQAAGYGVKVLAGGGQPADALTGPVAAARSEGQTVVVVTRDAGLDSNQAAAETAVLAAAGGGAIRLLTGLPYTRREDVTAAAATLAAYDDAGGAMAAVAAVLDGKRPVTGRPPVDYLIRTD